MFCSNCGAKQSDDANYCSECGTQLHRQVTASTSVESPEAEQTPRRKKSRTPDPWLGKDTLGRLVWIALMIFTVIVFIVLSSGILEQF